MLTASKWRHLLLTTFYALNTKRIIRNKSKSKTLEINFPVHFCSERFWVGTWATAVKQETCRTLINYKPIVVIRCIIFYSNFCKKYVNLSKSAVIISNLKRVPLWIKGPAGRNYRLLFPGAVLGSDLQEARRDKFPIFSESSGPKWTENEWVWIFKHHFSCARRAKCLGLSHILK